MKNGVDVTAVEGTADTHYKIPNFHVSAHHPDGECAGVVVAFGWAHAHAFVMETLIDELATRAKVDPIAYRAKAPEAGCQETAPGARSAGREERCLAH